MRLATFQRQRKRELAGDSALRNASGRRLARSLRRLLQEECGIALVSAISILGVLSASGATLIHYSDASARTARYSNAGAAAHGLAEAGVANGLSILNSATDPLAPSLLPATTVAMGEGTVTFSGQLTGEIWTITATAKAKNPTGAVNDVERTVTAQAEVRGIVPGATVDYWNRFYHDNPGTCLTIDTVTIPSSVSTRGNLCLTGPAKITGSTSIVEVGGNITLQSSSSIGNAGQRIAEAHVAGTCKYGSAPARRPCGAADRVYANTITTSPTRLTRPALDLPYWYEHAMPGPKYPCTVGSFPNGFDNDSIYNNSRPGGTSVDSAGIRYAEVTPLTRSYTCQVKDAGGNLLGEISWNHITHVLKIHGSVFIDGDVRFDDDGQLVNYQGRGIIFAAGDVEYDEVVCAGGNGTNNCWAGNMSAWDPETNMLIILSGGNSEYDQGQTMPRQPAALQGVLYAQGECIMHQLFKLSGPVICDRISLPFDEAWPAFSPWPPLGSLIDAQIYGTAATATNREVVVLGQYG